MFEISRVRRDRSVHGIGFDGVSSVGDVVNDDVVDQSEIGVGTMVNRAIFTDTLVVMVMVVTA